MTFPELYDIAFNPANTLLSIALILSIIYWIFTMISGIGHDFDIDFHLHTDVDVHAPDGTVEIPHDPTAFVQFLKFLQLDIIPITFFLTLVLLFTWMINVNICYFIPLPNWMYFITILPALIFSVFVTKYVCLPLKPIFKEINHKGEKAYDFLGRIGILKSTIKDDKLGMMELIINGDPIKLLAKSKDGFEIKDGEKVLIIDEHPDKKFYIVEKSYEL